MSNAFEQGFSLLKIDEGMWEEIYAPLLAETTGMGDKTSSRFATDFVPTDFAFETMRHSRPLAIGHGDQGWDQEQLMQSILEDGYDARSHEKRGRVDPSFHWSKDGGISTFEGNHRLHALRELGAPYVPFMGQGLTNAKGYQPHPINPTMKDALDNEKGYSIIDYMTRGNNSLGVPPSYLYGRELVPGMGRLEPVSPSGEPIDINRHISADGRGKEWDFKKKPSWKVAYDD
jgi:hypothetical protein